MSVLDISTHSDWVSSFYGSQQHLLLITDSVGFCDLVGGARGYLLTAGIGAIMGGAWGTIAGGIAGWMRWLAGSAGYSRLDHGGWIGNVLRTLEITARFEARGLTFPILLCYIELSKGGWYE